MTANEIGMTVADKECEIPKLSTRGVDTYDTSGIRSKTA